ncbi:VOC family protein [Nocardiopsis sp. NPDC007018]|uniref:VOC family protein n=1 Tax=Nocardiopsis sp. NPDC007018 TaxID=3155721 RepID=UPI003404D4DE
MRTGAGTGRTGPRLPRLPHPPPLTPRPRARDQPPGWPGSDAPQRFHLDFAARDPERAEAALLALGATRPGHQPGGDRWRVLLDPAGNPFCVTAS